MKDWKKHCLKRGMEYKKSQLTLQDLISIVSDQSSANVKEDVQR